MVTFAEGLKVPSGIALKGNDLYVAALNRVLRYRDIERTYRNRPQPEVVTDSLPTERHHGWKYLSVGPDGYLYVPVGAPCNICRREEDVFATILRMHPIPATGPSMRAACATASAWTGIRRPGSCGSPTTAATGWGPTCRRRR